LLSGTFFLFKFSISGILPITADSCGLITKTDAERLTAVLRMPCEASGARLPSSSLQRTNAIAVRHDCFGGFAF
jgi:hypothetical protein